MNTIDSLLNDFYNNKSQISQKIPVKDRRILLSLHKQVNSGIFLTENQAKLLVKILKENLKHLTQVIPDISLTISSNRWTKAFREIKKLKKIYKNIEDPRLFTVEFTFDSKIKEKISKFNNLLVSTSHGNGFRYSYFHNESNIFKIISALKEDNFEIEEKIMDTYKEVEEIKNFHTNPFEIFSTNHEKLKKSVIDDIVFIAPENLLMLQDRKIRYQYQIDQKIEENSLSAKIANRPNRKIFINSEIFSFNDVTTSLKELDRLPMLVVFDGHSSEKDVKSLKLVEDAVKTCNLGEEVGIYFRYDKASDTKHFNQAISSLNFNKNLKDETIVAGIANTKLPKFMLKMGWKPKTVISTTYSFKNNKAFVYCSDVDLIIYYGNIQPLDKDIYVLV